MRHEWASYSGDLSIAYYAPDGSQIIQELRQNSFVHLEESHSLDALKETAGDGDVLQLDHLGDHIDPQPGVGRQLDGDSNRCLADGLVRGWAGIVPG